MQPSINPPGGGNGVAAWMLQALQTDHDITLLCWAEPDRERIDWFYGTSLDWRRIDLRRPSALWHRYLNQLPLSLSLLRDGLLLRGARELSGRYDLTMGANNECDYGSPGIQYVHFPRFQSRRPAVDLHWYSRSKPIRDAYRWASVRATGFCMTRMRSNLTLCNSDWTRAMLKQELGIEATTLHPPVFIDQSGAPWRDREAAMVCVGRISPEKRLDLVLDLFLRLRAGGVVTQLHLVGTPDDDHYLRHIRSRVEAHRNCVSLATNLGRDELAQLMARSRWGIHGMREEHFGMAIAEMLRAGMVVFCPSQGGQVEIMGRDERVLYRDLDDAEQKVARAAHDEDHCQRLRAFLRRQAELFTVERFQEEFRSIVRAFVAQRKRASSDEPPAQGL